MDRPGGFPVNGVSRTKAAVQRRLVAWAAARNGNVAIIFALSILPMMVALAVGLDYVSAARKWTKLNAISDSAALAAVTPVMMGQSSTTAQAAAVNSFLAQAATIPDLNLNAANVKVVVTDTATVSGTSRSVTVNYAASHSDAFAGLLGRPTIAFSGKAASLTATNPNIDFYLLLDTSPSMAIAATQAGINQLVNLTAWQGGCAFACHETDPAADNLGNPNGWDNYTLARANSITLRIDLVSQATQNLMVSAQSMENSTHAKYRMAVYSFDTAVNTVASLNSNLTSVQTAASNLQVLTTYKNNWLTPTNNDGDTDTNWDQAMSTINNAMPSPGTGTNNSGDSPREFVFLVTDGVVDENTGQRIYEAMGGNWCSTIKNRGIKIAVLYTTYYPLPTNSWYNTYVAPFQSSIGPSLQSCASPGFFFQVDTGGDISSALNTLFQKAVGSAHLTQ